MAGTKPTLAVPEDEGSDSAPDTESEMAEAYEKVLRAKPEATRGYISSWNNDSIIIENSILKYSLAKAANNNGLVSYFDYNLPYFCIRNNWKGIY